MLSDTLVVEVELVAQGIEGREGHNALGRHHEEVHLRAQQGEGGGSSRAAHRVGGGRGGEKHAEAAEHHLARIRKREAECFLSQAGALASRVPHGPETQQAGAVKLSASGHGAVSSSNLLTKAAHEFVLGFEAVVGAHEKHAAVVLLVKHLLGAHR